MKTLKREETITISVNDFESENGKVFKNLTKQELISHIKSSLAVRDEKNKERCADEDKIHEFLSFKVDEKLLKKYSESAKIYPHFVYYHFRNWFSSSYGSNHCYNGGNYEHSRYNPTNGWHLKTIENINSKKMPNHDEVISIKDSVLMHFYSGGVIRMYGKPQNHKKIRDFKDKNERKKFFDYILDSGMISINKQEKISPIDSEYANDDVNDFNSEYGTIGEAFLHHCIRNKDLDTFKYLVEQKGLDLYAVDKKPYIQMSKRGDGEYYYGHKTSFLYRLIDEICNSNYEYCLAKCNKSDKYIQFFGELFAYINKKFPDLKIIATNCKKTIEKSNAVPGVLEESFGSRRYNENQIKKIQELFFGN